MPQVTVLHVSPNSLQTSFSVHLLVYISKCAHYNMGKASVRPVNQLRRQLTHKDIV